MRRSGRSKPKALKTSRVSRSLWAENLLVEELPEEETFVETEEFLMEDSPEEKLLLEEPPMEDFLPDDLADNTLIEDDVGKELNDDVDDLDDEMDGGDLIDDLETDEALAELEMKVQAAYSAKQEAYSRYVVKRDLAGETYAKMSGLWQKKMQIAGGKVDREEYIEIWQEFNDKKEDCDAKLKQLRMKIRRKRHKARRAMEKSKKSHQNGRHEMGLLNAEKSYKYMRICGTTKLEMMAILEKLREAYDEAERRVFGENAKSPEGVEEYLQVKSEYEQVEEEFCKLRKERNALYKEYDAKYSEYAKLRGKLLRKLKKREEAEKIAEKQRQNENLMAQFEVPLEYRQNCKVVKRGGVINFYFGGREESDGPEHGHIAVDAQGKVTYKRMPEREHGVHNFVLTG